MSKELAFGRAVCRGVPEGTWQHRGINELLGLLDEILEEHVGL